MIEVETYRQLPTDAARGEWQLLLEEDPHATIFQGPRFLGRWHATLGHEVDPRVHYVRRDGRLIGVVPEAHQREGSVTGPVEIRRFLGGTEVTDYLGPVARPEDRADVVDAYLGLLAAEKDWDELIAGGLMADADWAVLLRRAAGDHGLTVFEEDVDDVCPRVDLTGGYDAYLQRLPGKQRHELGRKARKLARDAGELQVVTVPAEQVHDELDGFLDMAAETEGHKSAFFADGEMRTWFKALAEEFVDDGVLRLHQLLAGGVPAAMTVSLVHGGEWGVYNSAFDPALRQLAPGMVLIGELIRLAAEEGATTLDLLRGDEPYKYRFGATDRTLRRITLVRR